MPQEIPSPESTAEAPLPKIGETPQQYQERTGQAPKIPSNFESEEELRERVKTARERVERADRIKKKLERPVKNTDELARATHALDTAREFDGAHYSLNISQTENPYSLTRAVAKLAQREERPFEIKRTLEKELPIVRLSYHAANGVVMVERWSEQGGGHLLGVDIIKDPAAVETTRKGESLSRITAKQLTELRLKPGSISESISQGEAVGYANLVGSANEFFKRMVEAGTNDIVADQIAGVEQKSRLLPKGTDFDPPPLDQAEAALRAQGIEPDNVALPSKEKTLAKIRRRMVSIRNFGKEAIGFSKEAAGMIFGDKERPANPIEAENLRLKIAETRLKQSADSRPFPNSQAEESTDQDQPLISKHPGPPNLESYVPLSEMINGVMEWRKKQKQDTFGQRIKANSIMLARLFTNGLLWGPLNFLVWRDRRRSKRSG